MKIEIEIRVTGTRNNMVRLRALVVEMEAKLPKRPSQERQAFHSVIVTLNIESETGAIDAKKGWVKMDRV